MDQVGTFKILEQIVSILNQSPPVVVGLGALSLVANIIQVGTYFRDRNNLKREKQERDRLATLVSTYEDVLKIAKETVEDKDKLQALKAEVQQQSTKAVQLTQKIKEVELAAQKAVIKRELDHRIASLNDTLLDVKELRTRYSSLGELPDVSKAQQQALEAEISSTVFRPFELPREFIFRGSLLVLILYLLPWPLEGLFSPFLLAFLLTVFVDTVMLFPDGKFRSLACRHISFITFIASLQVWHNFADAISSVASLFMAGLADVLKSELFELARLPFVFFAAWIQWQSLKRPLIEKTASALTHSERK